jgi:hypothetical protein
MNETLRMALIVLGLFVLVIAISGSIVWLELNSPDEGDGL